MTYLRRKLLFYLVAAWVAITINFLIPRLMPGSPVDALLGRLQQAGGAVSAEARASLELLLGYGGQGNLWEQYVGYLGNLLRGDFGVSSTYFPTEVSTILGAALPWTLVLVGLCTCLSFVLGVTLGMVVGWRRGGRLDNLVPIATFLAAVPYFWLALVLVFLLGSTLRLLPLTGGYEYGTVIGLNWEFIGSALYHALLPAITIVLSSVGGWLLGMRNMMVSTMGEDYVLTAEAKGLRPRRVMITYAARNAVIPSIAGFAISLGFVVSGSIVTEVVFSYPGIGFTLLQAVQNNDYPLMQAVFLVITLTVLGANLLVDLLYAVIDPRTRQAG
ncbi:MULTISPECIES: ABC transporter permease [Actinoalloteichus]|uniref:ABC-type dipeptide/oligopeptide/nickel transport system, permease component n=1 Tax=Actinoalloteichus fjordicus TaxID=1612552 RepID=A0AAC9LBF4_9PSEU|nr:MULTISPECIES: ABC transporter permease [Actinoalloteichus]APU13839.1 ABC-type dipeptide/oligopeptide/nickel transport system, permease component [Actinoalloteichus fjordicus]APU19785.1 ABC-type dipeptide/oligopeptide/nickel transport system, permease component [Actinoalloteichus sp. GBA129-24]